VVKASLVIARGSVFQLDFLPEQIRACSRAGSEASPSPEPAAVLEVTKADLRDLCARLLDNGESHGRLHKRVVELAEREIIRACLGRSEGQLAPAARLLGITRATLRKKMADLKIRVRRSVQD